VHPDDRCSVTALELPEASRLHRKILVVVWNLYDTDIHPVCSGPFAVAFVLVVCAAIFVFTARQLCERGVCRRRVSVCVCVCVCVCVSVCLCVTLRYCIKTAKCRITQTTPHDSPMTSFLMPKIIAKFERDHSLRGRQMQVGWVKIGHFRRKTRYNAKTVQDRHIVSIKVE